MFSWPLTAHSILLVPEVVHLLLLLYFVLEYSKQAAYGTTLAAPPSVTSPPQLACPLETLFVIYVASPLKLVAKPEIPCMFGLEVVLGRDGPQMLPSKQATHFCVWLIYP